jgi:hypothetical protein
MLKIIMKALVLLINAVLSLLFLLWGLYSEGLGDGVPARFYPALVVGVLLLPTLITLLVLSRSNKRAEELYWYLGIGSLLFIPLLNEIYTH